MNEPPHPPESEITPPEDKEEVDKALLEKALRQIRKAVKGNGTDPKTVRFKDFDGEVLHFESHAYFKIDPQISEKRLNGRHGADKIVGGLQDMRNQIKSTIEKVSDNPVVRKNTIDMLLHRDDLGYGLDKQAIMLDSLNKSFAVHESCQTCSGAAYSPCKYCHGAGYTTCTKCHGSREENCNQCQGRQFIAGQNGQQTPCPTCHGRGKARCLLCHGDGRINCRNCKSSGKMPCEQCAGTGWHSLISRMKVKAHSHFDYIDPYNEDSEYVPPEILPLLEDLGPLLVLEEHADVVLKENKVHDEELQRLSKNDEYIIPYYVRLPWGDITFDLGGEDVAGKLFGFNPALLDMPPFLEKTAATGINALLQAGSKAGGATSSINKALQYRLTAETILVSAKHGHKKSFALMKRRYPFGIGDSTLHKAVTAADKALKQMTLRPRLKGLALGLFLTALLYGLYYLGPLRALLMEVITIPSAQAMMDLMMIIAGGACTTLSIQLTAVKSLQNLLGKTLPAAKTKSLMPKAGQSAVWGYIGGFCIYFLMVYIAYLTNSSVPHWFERLFA